MALQLQIPENLLYVDNLAELVETTDVKTLQDVCGAAAARGMYDVINIAKQKMDLIPFSNVVLLGSAISNNRYLAHGVLKDANNIQEVSELAAKQGSISIIYILMQKENLNIRKLIDLANEYGHFDTAKSLQDFI